MVSWLAAGVHADCASRPPGVAVPAHHAVPLIKQPKHAPVQRIF